MERTTKIFLLDDTSKALKNQGFSEKQFQSGHSFSSQPRYDHFDTAAYYISNALPTHKKRGHHIENRRSFKIPVFARLFTKPSPTASYGFKSALVQPLRCCYLHFSPLRNQSYYTTPFLFSQVDKRDFSSFYAITRNNYNDGLIRLWKAQKRIAKTNHSSDAISVGELTYSTCISEVLPMRLQGCEVPPFFGPGCLYSLSKAKISPHNWLASGLYPAIKGGERR